jgi:hypothetical protein
MAENDECLKQWTVIQSLAAENEKPNCIQECLLKVYDEATVNMSTAGWWVTWIKEAETGGARLHDKLRSGCPPTATMPDIYQADELAYSNQSVKTDELFSTLSVKEV